MVEKMNPETIKEILRQCRVGSTIHYTINDSKTKGNIIFEGKIIAMSKDRALLYSEEMYLKKAGHGGSGSLEEYRIENKEYGHWNVALDYPSQLHFLSINSSPIKKIKVHI